MSSNMASSNLHSTEKRMNPILQKPIIFIKQFYGVLINAGVVIYFYAKPLV